MPKIRAEKKAVYGEKILKEPHLSEIFAYIEDPDIYLAELNIENAAEIISNMDSDDAVDVIEEMDDEVGQQIVELLNEETGRDVRLILSYEDDEIGSKMTTNFI